MIKMVNALTKTVMYVEDARKEEYLKNGHLLAIENTPSEETSKPATKKKSSKK